MKAAETVRDTVSLLAMSTTDDQTQEPQRRLYDLLDGEAGVRALVDRFYDLMDLEPAFAGIRAMHPPSLDGSRDKLFWFLSGWTGGPNLFIERFGHPRLRARHLPYAIGNSERDQWMQCMDMAMNDVGMVPSLQAHMRHAFAETADWMRNKQD